MKPKQLLSFLNFLFLSAPNFLSGKDVTSQVKKCCQDGFSLVRDQNLTCAEVSKPNATFRFSGGNSGILPNLCDGCVTKIHSLDEDLEFDCVDLYSNGYSSGLDLVGLKCAAGGNSGPPNPKKLSRYVERVNKCCPEGEVFDFERRDCVWNNETRDNVGVLGGGRGKYLHVLFGNPRCEFGMSDYEVEVSNVDYKEESLVMKWPSEKRELKLKAKREEFCTDKSAKRNKLVFRVCRDKDYCWRHSCLSKCSPADKNLNYVDKVLVEVEKTQSLHEAIAEDESERFIKWKKQVSSNLDYGLLTNRNCMKHTHFKNKNWTVNSRGQVRIFQTSKKKFNINDYCVDVVHNVTEENKPEIALFTCYLPDFNTVSVQYIIKGSLCLISYLCILVTIVIHVNSQTYGNLHSKCVLLFLIKYSLVFFTIGSSYFYIFNDTIVCKYWGYVIIYFCFSLCAWLNVIYFNIWTTISKSLQHERLIQYENKSTFIWYCIYAFFVPGAFTSIALLIDRFSFLPSEYQPNMDQIECWISSLPNFSKFLYLIFPLAFLCCINIVFFALTMSRYKKLMLYLQRTVVSDYSYLYRFQTIRNQWIMSVKLFIILVIPYAIETVVAVLEILDVDTGNEWWYYILEFFFVINDIQGVLAAAVYIFNHKKYLNLYL